MENQNRTPAPLTPASSAEIGEALKVLFNSLPFQRGTDPGTVVIAYIEALRGVSLDGVKAGISKFLRGECEGVNPRYVPTPPELARIVRTAVVPHRIPEERRIAPFRSADEGERIRMRLKMPMFQYAFARGLMDELQKAYVEGATASVALAIKWEIPVPQELLEMLERDGEREWHAARRRAEAENERNPPPFMRRRKREETRAAA